jgi:hypothetical protein
MAVLRSASWCLGAPDEPTIRGSFGLTGRRSLPPNKKTPAHNLLTPFLESIVVMKENTHIAHKALQRRLGTTTAGSVYQIARAAAIFWHSLKFGPYS